MNQIMNTIFAQIIKFVPFMVVLFIFAFYKQKLVYQNTEEIHKIDSQYVFIPLLLRFFNFVSSIRSSKRILRMNIIQKIRDKMVSNHILLLIMLIKGINGYYNIDISNPISLGSGTAISTLDFLRDQPFNNHFYVGFINGMVRKMSPNLSSGQTFQAVEQVDKFYNHYMLYNHTLANGTVNPISNFYVATVSRNRTIINLYSANNFTQIFTYVHNQTVLFYTGNPISYGGAVSSAYLLAGNQTIRLIYKTFNKAIVNFTKDYGAGVFCMSATLLDLVLSTSGDTLILTYYIHALTSTSSNKKFQITLYFTLNVTAATYDMTAPYVYAQNQLLMPQSIVRARKFNQMILLQANNSGNIYAFNSTTSYSINFHWQIPKDNLVSFFSFDGDYYLLTQMQLVLLFYNPCNTQYSVVANISNFPANNFVQTFGTYFDLLLIPFTSNVYMSSRCGPQEWFDGTNCVTFACNDPHCLTCSNLPNVCTTCAYSYTVTIDGSCSSSITNSTSNYTNGANQTNANTTSSVNSTNSTGPNNTINSTDSSNSTNSTTSNSSTNSSDSNNTLPFLPFNPFTNNASFNIFLGLLQSTWTKKIYQQAKQTTMLAIAIPAARRIASPLFYYFGNFDDLFLYSFHNRTYGETMKFVFGEINQIQAKKWSIINYQTIVDFFGNSSAFDSFIGYQSPYMSATRVFTDGESHDSLSLVASCTNFFVVSAPITLVTFFTLSLAFRLLFRFRVSQFLRKFDFLGFLFILLFEGNVQQFAFFLGFEWREAFSFSFSTKLLKSSVVFFGFAVISLSVCGYFVCYAFYRKLNKYIMDNNKNSISGIFFLLIQNGLRNLVLGMAHSLLRDADYETLLSSLLSIELISYALFIYSANNLNYEKVYSIWIYIFMTFVRLLLILTFFLDSGNVDLNVIENTQTGIVLLMMLVYFVSIIVGVVGLIIETIIKIVKIIKSKRQKKQEQKNLSKIEIAFEQKRGLNKTMFKVTEDQLEKKPSKQLLKTNCNPKKCVFRKDRKIYTIKQVYGGVNQYMRSQRFT